jgi:hypothetical protein
MAEAVAEVYRTLLMKPADNPFSPAGSETRDASFVGMIARCRFDVSRAADVQKALADCEADLARIKNLGVGWVRIDISWAAVAEAHGNLLSERRSLLMRCLRAARLKGLNILVELGLDAPAHPIAPEAFSRFAGQVVDVASPYSAHFGLLDGTSAQSPETARDLQASFRQLLDSKRTSSFNPVNHTSALSSLWKQRGRGLPPVQRAILKESAQVVDLIPGQWSADLLGASAGEMHFFTEDHPVWVTEATGGDVRESELVAQFKGYTALYQNKSIDKFFWSDVQAIAAKPALIEAIREMTRIIPFEYRFDMFQSSVLTDLYSEATQASWHGNGGMNQLLASQQNEPDSPLGLGRIAAGDKITHPKTISVRLGYAKTTEVFGDYPTIQIP